MRRNSKGVTLVELITAAALLVVVLMPVSLIFHQGYKNYYIERDTLNTQQKAREAMEAIMNDLRGNDSGVIAVLDADGSAVGLEYGNVLRIRGNILYSYTPASKVLYRKTSFEQLDNNAEMLCDYVTDFKVMKITEGYENALIKIDFKVQEGRGREIELNNSYRIKTD